MCKTPVMAAAPTTIAIMMIVAKTMMTDTVLFGEDGLAD